MSFYTCVLELQEVFLQIYTHVNYKDLVLQGTGSSHHIPINTALLSIHPSLTSQLRFQEFSASPEDSYYNFGNLLDLSDYNGDPLERLYLFWGYCPRTTTEQSSIRVIKFIDVCLAVYMGGHFLLFDCTNSVVYACNPHSAERTKHNYKLESRLDTMISLQRAFYSVQSLTDYNHLGYFMAMMQFCNAFFHWSNAGFSTRTFCRNFLEMRLYLAACDIHVITGMLCSSLKRKKRTFCLSLFLSSPITSKIILGWFQRLFQFKCYQFNSRLSPMFKFQVA